MAFCKRLFPLGLSLKKLLHKRHYEKFADGTVKDIEDEIPFDVPEGWAWSRLSNICNIIGGVSYNKNDVAQTGIKILRGGNIQDGKIIECDDDIFIPVSYKDSTNSVYKNDIVLVASTGSSLLIGKTGFTKRTIENTQIGAFLRILRTTHFCNAEFINSIFLSDYYKNYIRNLAKGTNINNVKTEYLTNFLIPLPPSNEQYEIIIVLNSFLEKVEYLESNKTELQKTIAKTKSKILDLAIHGKLVPQDSNDEPASVLLEKLRVEKEEKIAKGELKRDKNDSYIYKGSDNCYYEKFADGTIETIEIPFELPETWCWCLFGEIATVINGKNQSKVANSKGQYPIYGSGGVMGRADDYICPENCTIIGRKGSINNPIFVTEKFWNVDTAFGLCTNNLVLPKYLFYFCKTFDFTTIDSSTTLPSLTKTNIQQILFPLPPLENQKRIIEKIDVLFKKLDNICLNLI